MIINAVEFKRCLGIERELEHGQELSKPVRWLQNLLFLGFLSFALIQYLPVSGKTQNNVAYVAILLPALLLSFLRIRHFTDVVRTTWPLWCFFAAVACAALVLVESSFLKTTLYTALYSLGDA